MRRPVNGQEMERSLLEEILGSRNLGAFWCVVLVGVWGRGRLGLQTGSHHGLPCVQSRSVEALGGNGHFPG